MINLLSPDTRRQIKSAHANVLLLRYVVLLGITALVITGIFGAGYYMLIQDEAAAKNFTKQYEGDKAQYAKDIEEGKAFADNLKAAKTILANEVLFSDLLITIAKTLPSESAIASFTSTTDALQKPMEISIKTTSYDKVVTIKEVFEASPAFENVSINNVSQIESTQSKYNTEVSLNVTLTKDALVKGVAR